MAVRVILTQQGELVDVVCDGPAPPPPTWQEMMYPGLLPESVAVQGEMFALPPPRQRKAPNDETAAPLFKDK